MVQVRWGHLNRQFSSLTQAQALLIDGHFVIEHTARNRAGNFFNFNGTAGIWRKSVIADAGGWSHDTVTEDLDLSYRAQLRGWKFIYLPEIVAPAELPVEMDSFKSQQYRWAKGSIQTAVKLLPKILKAKIPFHIKAEAFMHLTNNFAYPLVLLTSLLMVVVVVFGPSLSPTAMFLVDFPLVFGTNVSMASFYLTSEREIDPTGWPRTFIHLPLLIALGVGLCINQTRAVWDGLFGRSCEFVRTPKHGVAKRGESWEKKRYHAKRSLVPYIEVALALYFAGGIGYAVTHDRWLALPFLTLFMCSFGYVGALSLLQYLRARRLTAAPETADAIACEAGLLM